MAVKGPLWFLSRALDQERSRTHLSFLSSRALDLGLKKTDATRGHLFQAVGAVQKFLDQYPNHLTTIKSTSPLDPYKPSGQVLKDWRNFIAGSNGSYERASFGYNYGTLKGYLTAKYGGNRTGGGGGDNELEIAFRLVAEFL
jgi:hypothetical protein